MVHITPFCVRSLHMYTRTHIHPKTDRQTNRHTHTHHHTHRGFYSLHSVAPLIVAEPVDDAHRPESSQRYQEAAQVHRLALRHLTHF